MIWVFLTALGLATFPLPLQQTCDAARTTVEMELCLQTKLKAQDSLLLSIETQVRARLPAAARGHFAKATARWKDYRAEECNAVYAESAGGSIAVSAMLGCKITLTKERVAALRQIYPLNR